MTHGLMLVLLAAIPTVGAATATKAQETGIYGVVRGGGSITPKQKIDVDDLSAAFPDDAKYKTGFTGQIGAGYDFGRFRIEQTLGYGKNELNAKDLTSSGFNGEGSTKSLSMTLAGYVDIPVTARIVPYVGGGVGAARVQTELTGSRIGSGQTSGFEGKDWGLMWHADAGIGVRMAPKTTLEVGVRYAQTSRLKYDGVNAAPKTSYEPKLSSVSGTVGVRHVF
ncbi:outer membrane protein [Caulobacter segnis]|uniref:outer membrane protein n=1 Tax=Caulobacter segnis TaxID=88688 RepID=UPI001CBC502F|nr:outer membrane beta-barrel protein [Caulobacter segnis]UAL12452.1 porin family protein [Caulobacter segnis]